MYVHDIAFLMTLYTTPKTSRVKRCLKILFHVSFHVIVEKKIQEHSLLKGNHK